MPDCAHNDTLRIGINRIYYAKIAKLISSQSLILAAQRFAFERRIGKHPERFLYPYIILSNERDWRRGWDSNPRTPFGVTRFPIASFQPLTHLSGNAEVGSWKWERKNMPRLDRFDFQLPRSNFQVRPARFELAACGFVDRRSIQVELRAHQKRHAIIIPALFGKVKISCRPASRRTPTKL